MIDEHLARGSVIDQHELDSNGPPLGPARAHSTSNKGEISPQCPFDPHTEEVSTQDGPVEIYPDGAYCPVKWDPVERRWLRDPVTVCRDEEQPDGASGGEDPMLREAAE